MPIYEVEIRREQVAYLYVQADDKKEAMNDAAELVFNDDFDVVDDDIVAGEIPLEKMRKGQKYWSGGPDGDWVDA